MERVGNLLPTAGMPPWDEALLATVRAAEARLELARQEYALLLVENRKLRKSLAECRRRLENWNERYRAGRVNF